MDVSKKTEHLKRYIYISQRKIGMYDSQLPRHWWKRLIDWLLHISRLKVGPVEVDLPAHNLPARQKKLQKIIEQITKENAIGTVDQPATYIHDTLDMFIIHMPAKPEYRRLPDDPGFIYFGGGTKHTSIALVGSPQHLIGAIPDEKARLSSSDLPRLVMYINKRINEIVPGRKPRYDGLGTIWHADTYNTDPRIPLEFFAYRIHDSEQRTFGHPSHAKRVLLYTPLYVTYKD